MLHLRQWAWLGLPLLAGGLSGQEPPDLPRYGESLNVSRVVLDARVVDGRGAPLLGLQPGDFRVRVDGRPVAVESVRWVTGAPPALPPEQAALAAALPPLAPGRLVVLLFQKDLFERSRVGGLMKMATRGREVVAGLAPDDRVAVLVYDSRLRLLCDFSSDRARVRRAIERGVLFEGDLPWAPSGFPSLAAHLDRRAASRAAWLESALLELGRALEPLPGAKSLVLFGYGLGRLTGGRVVPENDYGSAVLALERARVSVFSLDVTNADAHSLEVGLMDVAADTGRLLRAHPPVPRPGPGPPRARPARPLRADARGPRRGRQPRAADRGARPGRRSAGTPLVRELSRRTSRPA